MNRKHVGLILRWALAVAGLALIAWTVVWSDAVVLPAGYRPQGAEKALKQSVSLGIIKQTPDHWVLSPIPSFGDAAPEPVVLPVTELGETADTPRFKPGVLSVLRSARWDWVVGGLLLMGLIFPLQAVRWFLLMRCQQLPVSLKQALQLTMVGQFFNICMPGATGGDVMKAYYVAKGAESRTVAIMSVIFDRIIGLVALVLLAGMVSLTVLDDPMVRRLAVLLWLGLAGMGIGAAMYFSRRFRRWLRVDALIRRLPDVLLRSLRKIDSAAVAYARHKRVVFGALGLSLVVHLCLTLATALAGYALGIEHGLGRMLTALPIVFLIASIPITPQGIGVMEFAGLGLLMAPGLATENQVLGMMLILRGFHVAYALMGAGLMVRGNIHLHPQTDEKDTPEPPPDRWRRGAA